MDKRQNYSTCYSLKCWMKDDLAKLLSQRARIDDLDILANASRTNSVDDVQIRLHLANGSFEYGGCITR